MRNRRYKRPPQVAPAQKASETVHAQFAAKVKLGPPALTPIKLPSVPEHNRRRKPVSPTITPKPSPEKPAGRHPRSGPPALTPEND